MPAAMSSLLQPCISDRGCRTAISTFSMRAAHLADALGERLAALIRDGARQISSIVLLEQAPST